MRTVCRIVAIGLMMIVLSAVTAEAQRSKSPPPENIVGMDLEKVKQIYQRAINGGNVSYTVHYAEALYFAGMFNEAVSIYERADSLDLIVSDHQKRNYVHAALRSGRESPYVQDTDYFSREWDMKADIRPFCSNSPNEDFAPYYWNDILFVTSSRDMSASGRYDFTNKPFLNVHAFISNCISIGIPPILPQDINTVMHDGPVAISHDGSLVVVTRNYKNPTERGVYNLYLDFYQRLDDKWTRQKMFPHIGADCSVQHPFYTDHDSTLYFSSNIPDGFGGFDLYTSKWDGQSWGKPVNMGPEINSIYDEVFPSFTPQGHLIYASNHIETNGGMDLVLFHQNNRYLLPEPFNTIYDDFSITFRNETAGYFTSNRDRSNFNDDIFSFEVTVFAPPLFDYLVEVLDEHTGEPIEGVEVKYLSIGAQAQGMLSTPENGMALLRKGSDELHAFSFELSHPEYERKTVFSSDFEDREGSFVMTMQMSRLQKQVVEEDVLARGFFMVYFDNDQPDPRSNHPATDLSYEETYHAYMLRKPDFYQYSANTDAELDAFFEHVSQGMEQLHTFADHLLAELGRGRQYTIIFTSHASPLASGDYNMTLSQRRFVSVMNFLRQWQGGVLAAYIDSGALNYTNNPFGSVQATGRVSDNREDPSRSVFGVAASRERRVTITWRSSNESGEE